MTPKLMNEKANVTIVVEAQFANSEIGFLDVNDYIAEEPESNEKPLIISLELYREGNYF